MLIFDWQARGHHELYVRRFAAVLEPHAEVIAAVPDEMGRRLSDAPVEVLALGDERPEVDGRRHLARESRSVEAREVELFAEAIERARPDRAVHMFADGAVRDLLRRPPLPTAVTLCLFRPRAHYRRAYGARLSLRERAAGRALDTLVARWRRRPDAHSLLTLDAGAAEDWSGRPGAPAFWLPEPWVEPVGPDPLPPWQRRRGCVLYGALAERKGIDLLAAAVGRAADPPPIVLAGAAAPEFTPELERLVAAMRDAGAEVELRPRWHGPDEALATIAAARCSLLPYPDHFGMSRVLLESCSVDTPVVVHDRGLLGHLVRRHGVGAAVDCRDAGAFADAIDRGTSPEADPRPLQALRRFSRDYAPEAFERSVMAAIAPADRSDQAHESRR